MARDDHTADRVDRLDGPVYVWGAGVHTAQLFDRTDLIRDAKVKAIVDRDSQKWGLTQPIVISSFAAEAQIAKSLSEAGIAARNIVRLYG